MWTSNSGPPFNQPSKSSTKWAFVRYRPGAVGGGAQIRRGDAGALRHGREGVPAPGREKPLERQLVLAERGAIELTLHVSAEGGVAERERKGARQELGVRRRGEDIRPTRGVGCSAGWAVRAGERAHQQGERCGP